MSTKKIKLRQKEIDNADASGITIISRPQGDGMYWVAAVDVNRHEVVIEGEIVPKYHVSSAIRSVLRAVSKNTGYNSDMADVGRKRPGRKMSERKQVERDSLEKTASDLEALTNSLTHS